MPLQILLIDDSATVRGLMRQALESDKDLVVCGTAVNGEMGVKLAAQTKPDIIILDIEMPVMDGITALPLLRKESPSSKIIIASTLSHRNAEISLKALSLGATDYLAKPSAKPQAAGEFFRELLAKIRAIGGLEYKQPTIEIKGIQLPVNKPATDAAKRTKPGSTGISKQQLTPVATPNLRHIKALAIASSTGGPQALLDLFGALKGHLITLPIFITQHMPPTFTTILAENIEKIAGRRCIEATQGELVKPGMIYLAPGDYHMIPACNTQQEVVIHITQDEPENYCRPAADPMFRALAKIYQHQLAALVLTGMGQDGAEGARDIVAAGGQIIAQDEASCVVYGMPKAVVEQKICRNVLPLNDIAGYLIQQIEGL